MSNDTQTVTLTDFLLARIAEDEVVAQESRPHEYLTHRDAPHLHWERDVSGYGQIIATSGRVLAECEAKRRIVNLAVDGFEHNPNSTLHILAAIYSNHPDYRAEWAS